MFDTISAREIQARTLRLINETLAIRQEAVRRGRIDIVALANEDLYALDKLFRQVAAMMGATA